MVGAIAVLGASVALNWHTLRHGACPARIFWSWIARMWPDWRDALVIVQPETVIAWQRKRFRDHWTKLSRYGEPGRPSVPKEIIELIRKMSAANVCWGSPRIVGELRKLRSDVAKSTVEKYRVRLRNPSSPTWKSFLNNHVKDLVSIDFLVVPTVGFRMVFTGGNVASASKAWVSKRS